MHSSDYRLFPWNSEPTADWVRETVYDPSTVVRALIRRDFGACARLLYEGMAPEWLRPSQLERGLIARISSGQLRLYRRRRLPVALPPPDSVGPAREIPWDADAPEPLGEENETWFELRLVDEVGEPIDGVNITMSPGGVFPTDGSGIARTDSPMRASGGAEVLSLAELRAAVAPRWNDCRDAPWIDVGPSDRSIALVGEPSTSMFLPAERTQTLIVQPWVVRLQLEGLGFDTNKSFLLPDAVRRRGGSAPIDRVRRWLADHPNSVACVVGHTDASGDPWFNDPLSLERANAFVAYLERDVEHWLSWYVHGDAQKRWGWIEDRHMRDAVCERHHLGEGIQGTRAFQAFAGLEVDGVIGPDTRRALVEAYMDLQDLETEVPASLEAHGCGESFPKMVKANVGGEAGEVLAPDQADHRRVELFLFPEETGIQPPPPGRTSPAGSEVYPEWVRRARHTRSIPLQSTPTDVFIVVVHELGHGGGPPLAQAEVELRAEGENAGRTELSNAVGVCHFRDVPPGEYTVVGTKDGFEVVERPLFVEGGGEVHGLDSHEQHDFAHADHDGGESFGASHDTLGMPPNTRVLPMFQMGDVHIIEFIGRSPSYPEQPFDHGTPLPDNFVYFGQGEKVDLSFVVEAPSKPEVFIRRLKDGDPFKEKIQGLTQIPGENRWRGTVRYDLQKETRFRKPNPKYAPPRFDGRYTLEARHPAGFDEADVIAAGIVMFNAIPLNGATMRAGKNTVPSARGEKGNFREAPFNHWVVQSPHAMIEGGRDYRFVWEVIGSRHVKLQLEVLGEGPTAKPGFGGRWQLEEQNDFRNANTTVEVGFSADRSVKFPSVRANLNVFRGGTSQSVMSSAFEELPSGEDGHSAGSRGEEVRHIDVLGSSTLLVHEARPSEVFDTAVPPELDANGNKKRTPPLFMPIPAPPYGAAPVSGKPAPTVGGPPDGYYQGYEAEERHSLFGQRHLIEILERVRAIWLETHAGSPFGLGEMFAPKPGHLSHFMGTALDIMLFRKDPAGLVVLEKRTRGNSIKVRLFKPDGSTVVPSIDQVTTRQMKSTKNSAPFDFEKMQDLLMLFAQIARQGGGPSASTYDRFLLDDHGIVDEINRLEPTSGAKMDSRAGFDQHGWHAHLAIRGT